MPLPIVRLWERILSIFDHESKVAEAVAACVTIWWALSRNFAPAGSPQSLSRDLLSATFPWSVWLVFCTVAAVLKLTGLLLGGRARSTRTVRISKWLRFVGAVMGAYFWSAVTVAVLLTDIWAPALPAYAGYISINGYVLVHVLRGGGQWTRRG